MDEADESTEAYDKLINNMPAIGIMSRKKRIRAYIKITNMTQEMVDNHLISEDNALFILSMLGRKCATFQKATMMMLLNLPNFDTKLLKPIGFRYANECRCNLQMYPVDDDKSIQP